MILGHRAAFVLFVAVLFCVSCSREARKPVHPARGKVATKKGAALEGVLVILTPVGNAASETDWPHGFPRATTDKDGAFVLTTYESGDGIPVGEYAVTLLWTPKMERERAAPDKFGGRYADPKKPTWKVKIVEGENELPTFTVAP
ncbi:MAG: carboxypeptidase regulatory-like domain-containing protein [Planctomycetes bacterium]|nr:carboxypeptidase regulatory-like domain-containing protein [Planctomycetota bacterium]